jgi:hypothetical protein
MKALNTDRTRRKGDQGEPTAHKTCAQKKKATQTQKEKRADTYN